jgi:hypothetical protein
MVDYRIDPWRDGGAKQDCDRVHKGNHLWRRDDMRRVGWIRQRCIETAFSDPGCTHVWMVDDDVICGPEVLSRLLMADAPVAYGVYWTTWNGADKAMPQVWDVEHPYGLSQTAYTALERGETIEVVGGGACTLIRRDAVVRPDGSMRGLYWPPPSGLPRGGMWQGEDRWAGLRWCLETPYVRQVAVGGLRIEHAYSEEQRTVEWCDEAMTRVGLA